MATVDLGDRRGKIEHDGPVPVWRQVADDLTREIASGALVGRLPAEVDLADSYGVARNTVRRAIRQLADDGVLTVVHGRGTFVANR